MSAHPAPPPLLAPTMLTKSQIELFRRLSLRYGAGFVRPDEREDLQALRWLGYVETAGDFGKVTAKGKATGTGMS